MTGTKTIEALRELAAWLEAHPELHELEFYVQTLLFQAANKAEAATVARALGKTQKNYFEDVLFLEGAVGHCGVSILIKRDQVCRKVVTKVIEPAKPATPGTPEREVEKVEWVCDEPVLAETPEAITA